MKIMTSMSSEYVTNRRSQETPKTWQRECVCTQAVRDDDYTCLWGQAGQSHLNHWGNRSQELLRVHLWEAFANAFCLQTGHWMWSFSPLFLNLFDVEVISFLPCDSLQHFPVKVLNFWSPAYNKSYSGLLQNLFGSFWCSFTFEEKHSPDILWSILISYSDSSKSDQSSSCKSISLCNI